MCEKITHLQENGDFFEKNEENINYIHLTM